jgi:serine/threonine protein kinase
MGKPPDKKGALYRGKIPPPPPAVRKPPPPPAIPKAPPLPAPVEISATPVNAPELKMGEPEPVSQLREKEENFPQTKDYPEESTVAQGWIGRIIDNRYRINELIGEGGMGSVFAAEHLNLHKDVAVKIIRPDYGSDGEVAVRFAREAMATAQLEHPHVVSAIDYGPLPEGGAYLVMQLVRGRSLTEILELQGQLHWSKACELGAQVADAMSAANSLGIVHRDLKPDNILIQPRKDGTDLVKILDFGIARIRDQGRSAPAGAMPAEKLTQTGAIVGTPGYMAPEQAVGDKIDHRADLYALGVVLWETIVGRRLWNIDDMMTLIKTQLGKPAPRIREVVDDETIPKELDDLIAQLLSRSPSDRPSQAGVVCDILRKLSYAPLTGEYPSFQMTKRGSGQQSDTEKEKTIAEICVKKAREYRHWILGFALILSMLLIGFLLSR